MHGALAKAASDDITAKTKAESFGRKNISSSKVYEKDGQSSGLFYQSSQTACEYIRVLSERLPDASRFTPVPMDEGETSVMTTVQVPESREASLNSTSEKTARHGGRDRQSVVKVDEAEMKTNTALLDDWDVDPDNPRNWPSSKKWVAVAIVCPFTFWSATLFKISFAIFQVSFYTLFPPLASSMMAPGLPEMAEKYHILNPTVLAMTLSIFLISFAIGVGLRVYIKAYRKMKF